MPSKRSRHRRRSGYPTGLALGLCLVSGASAVLLVSVPEPSDVVDPLRETSATAPVPSDAPDENGSTTASDDAAAASPKPSPSPSPSESPEGDEEDNVLLRSIEEEVDSADGSLTTMSGEGEVMGDGPLLTFAVEVEDGLPGEDGDFVEAVELILGDPRSWGDDGERSLQRVDSEGADIRVLLAAPDTVDELCAPLRTNGYVSCAQGNRAIINQNRWVSGVDHFEDDLETYRIYLINHEVGHTLGHGHVQCPGEDELAPVMQQQTLDLQGCEPNGWVHPDNEAEDD